MNKLSEKFKPILINAFAEILTFEKYPFIYSSIFDNRFREAYRHKVNKNYTFKDHKWFMLEKKKLAVNGKANYKTNGTP